MSNRDPCWKSPRGRQPQDGPDVVGGEDRASAGHGAAGGRVGHGAGVVVFDEELAGAALVDGVDGVGGVGGG